MSEKEQLDQVEEVVNEVPVEEVPAEVTPAEEPKKKEKSSDKKAKDKAKAKKKKENKFFRWLREMRSELKKVQWPGWKQVAKNTLTVILCVLIIGVFIWIFDALAHKIIQALMNLFA